jgi:hypothetical protein
VTGRPRPANLQRGTQSDSLSRIWLAECLIRSGGIIVGGAIAERPDLFAAAVRGVGAFNMARFELTANGPGDDAEFGTLTKEFEFHALLASKFDNVSPKSRPNVDRNDRALHRRCGNGDLLRRHR